MKQIIPIGKSFWEEKHSKSDLQWLAGTDMIPLLKYYNLLPTDLLGKRVMEIGIGMGNAVSEMSKIAWKTYAVDISDLALERIKNNVDQTYQTNNLKYAPECDIIICHLVFLHCDDDEVTRIINDIPLSENGKLYFHFSGLKDNVITEKVQTLLIDNGTHFFRDYEEMKKIIQNTNKELTYITQPYYGGEYYGNWLHHEWYFGIIENKK